MPGAPFIAITGTNGKSTTTALIAHLLTAAGRDVQLGGNIGTAILSLEPPRTGRYHVIECSSFQIDLAPSLNPSIGVLLNVTPDHLDRHGTLERLRPRSRSGWSRSPTPRSSPSTTTGARRSPTGWRGRPRRSSASRRAGRWPTASMPRAAAISSRRRGRRLDDGSPSLAGIGSLRGAHNAQNAAAAVAAARALGLDDATIADGLRSFPGLPHRMEEVGRRGRVLFVNDSKATNADAAAKALASFARIYWIAGGRPKEGGIASLDRFLPAHRQGLPDRRGGGRVSPRRSATRVPMRCPARSPRRSPPRRADAADRSGAGAGGAPVAGLRVLRPVPEFRAARRCLPRARPSLDGHHQPRGRPPDGQPRRSQPIRRVVVDGRQDTCSPASSP